MPKGRHLKPDFFTDKNIVGMSPLARLLYQGLWCYAHDCGHLDDEPVELKMRILPADNCDVDELLDEVAWHGRIVRELGVLFLPKLAEHARVDKRYETACDACKVTKSHGVTTPGEGSPKGSNTTGPRSDHGVTTQGTQRDHDADGDGDGDGDGEVMVKGAAKRRATAIPDSWRPTDAHRAIALEERVNCGLEAVKFRDSALTKDRKYVDWDAAFRNWLRSPYAVKSGPMPEVTDPSQLPPVEGSWMRRKR
jgi:hypothetical protein